MADAVELAAAYVSLVPSFEGAQGKITKELVPEAERAGDKAGQGFGGKFSGFLGGGAFAGVMAGAGVAVGAAVVDGFMSAIERADAGKLTQAQFGLNDGQAAAAGAASGAIYGSGFIGATSEEINAGVGAAITAFPELRDAGAGALEDVTKRGLAAAKVLGVDVADATDVAGQMVRDGLAGNAGQAFDMIVAAGQKVGPGLRAPIMDAADEYGGFFAAVGMDGPAALGLLTTAAQDGGFGLDKAGDAVKEFTIRATDMSTSSVAAYEAIGMNAQEAAGKIAAGGAGARETFDQVVAGLLSIEDPAARSNAAIALFGTPLEDIGVQKVPTFLKSLQTGGAGLGDFEGKALGAADTINSGPGVALESLGRTVETTFATFAAVALPAITAFSGWLGDNTWAVGVFAGVVGVALVAGFVALAASVWAANAAFWASPTTWIVLGIVAVVAALALLIANWDAVAGFLAGVWAGVVDFAVGIWQGLGDFFAGWISSVVAWFNGGIAGLASWLSGMWSGISGTAMGIWNGLVGWVAGIPGRILGGLSYLGALAGIAAGWFGGVLSSATGKFGELVGWVGGVPGRILGALGNLGGLLLGAGGNIMQGFLDGLIGTWGKVQDFVGGVGQWIADHKGPKSYDLALLVPAGGWIMEGLGAGIAAGLPNLRRTLDGVSDTVAGGLGRSRVAANLAAFGSASSSGLEPAAGGASPVTVLVENPWGTGYLEGKVRGVVDEGIGKANHDISRRRPGGR